MGNKVYVVTFNKIGEYANPVDAVFTSREKAIEYADRSRSGRYRIQDHPLDPNPKPELDYPDHLCDLVIVTRKAENE